MEVRFSINGCEYNVSPSTVHLDTTLNSFIRNHAKLTGTKFMCLEGGCGACIVTLCGIHPVTKEKHSWAVNSCLQNVYSCHGLEITTVEGIGSKREGMHKIQKRLANLNGTQCGYCSPGMVMNMYSLMESKDNQVTMKDVENSFGGNICRCTGYRPILDAFKSLAVDASKELLNSCSDIEDCNQTTNCPKTGMICNKSCKSQTEQIKIFTFDDRMWYRVFTTTEVLKIFGEIGDKPYMLVAGNTAHGVYRRSPDLKVFIDISNVEELRSYKINQNSLELGANMTLSECMKVFSKIADENASFSYLHEVVSHFDLIANVPVRDNGTLAGNLMIKNQHNEFPSDIFLLFETIGAVFKVVNSFESCLKEITDVDPKRFIATNMHKKLLTKIILPAYDPSKFVFRSFKIMPRAQNAHAYVNAGFLLEMNQTKVISAKICFGGINPNFIHAEKTEKFLVGQDLFKNETLQQALSTLSDEINPDWVLPDASPEYRKNLALSLFYKFVLNIAPNEKVSDSFRSGGEILKRGLSSGTQTFDTYEQNWPITKNIPKIEADVQCTGEAKYVNDFPKVSNELHAAFVTAKIVHKIIKSIDASEALKIPDVVAFYSAKDIPGNNDALPYTAMPDSEMEEIFCQSQVRFYNQPVGIIVAESFEAANRASELVKITYEDNDQDKHKRVIATLRDVIDQAPERIELKPGSSSQRLVESSIEGKHKISGRFEMENQYHFTMETQTCLCIPIEDGLDVYSATQWMDATQIAISDMLKIPNNHINMYVRRLGGGFGSKISRANQVACACALAAHLLNRPVRFVMSLEANMNIIGKRNACINFYDVKVDDDGKIHELNAAYTEDYGCFKNESPLDISTGLMKNCYDHRHFQIDASIAVTDVASNSWCRAPGTVEGIGMIENIMEHIAFSVGKDPFDVRMANIPDDSPMKEYMLDFAKSTDYQQRRNEIDDFNSRNRWRKRGIGIVPLKYPLNFFGTKHAMVSIYHGDGSVSVAVGGIEMGQGLNTKVAQTVALTLGIPLDKIQIKPSNSFSSPNAIVTGGSQGSEVSCFAVAKACEILNERLKPIKAKNPNNEWSETIAEAHNSNVDLVGTYMYKSTDLESYNIWAASCAEVEVDVLTGNILINRVDIMEDVGESLSPGIDIGQIEGGFVMGLGYWLTESLVYDRITGELLTNRSWNYKPPGAKDIPIDFRINFLKKSSNPFGVLRSKATGEPSTAMAVVVLCALHHALDSARKDAGTIGNGYQFKLGAPTTVESTFLASDTSFEQFLLE
ncbi:uncharacterized protein [Chironomus tepperi]|uniref:uncharacterized protein n=1 Tax=Chironomus tepperi TaxID=113505 RepID=UPI00391F738C